MPKTIPDPMITNGRMISKNAEIICLVVSVRFNSIGHQRTLRLRFVSIIKYALFKLNFVFSSYFGSFLGFLIPFFLLLFGEIMILQPRIIFLFLSFQKYTIKVFLHMFWLFATFLITRTE